MADGDSDADAVPDAVPVADMLGEPVCDGRAAVDPVALRDSDTLDACEPLGVCDDSALLLLLLLLRVGVALSVRLADRLRDA